MRIRYHSIFRKLYLIYLILDFLPISAQSLCDQLPSGSVKGAFEIEGNITSGCSPLTIKLNDLSGGSDIRYDFYYNGKSEKLLDKIGNKDSVNSYLTNSKIEVYQILQYGEKNGNEMFECKNIIVKPNSKPLFSYNSCNSNYLNINIPTNQINNFDSYFIGWDDGSPPTVFKDLPFSISKTFNNDKPFRSIIVKGIETNSSNCSLPDSTRIDLNHGGNIPKVVSLTVLNDGLQGKLEFEGAYDKHSIYRIDKFGQYSIPNLIGIFEPGVVDLALKKNEPNCFIVLRNPNPSYSSCNEISGEICTVQIDTLLYLSQTENQIKLKDYSSTNEVNLINNSKVLTIDNSIIVRNITLDTTSFVQISNNDLIDHQKCSDKVCYQLKTQISGEWESGNTKIPFKTTSYSNEKCTDRVSIIAPPINNTLVNVTSNNSLEFSFSDNIDWIGEKDIFYLFKGQFESFQKIDSLYSFQNKIFNLNENVNSASYCYKIGYKDKCGSNSELSNPICSIFLQQSKSSEIEWSINSPFGNSNIENFELISYEESTNIGTIEKIINKNEKSILLDLSTKEKVAKYKIKALSKDNTGSFSNLIIISIKPLIIIPEAFSPNNDTFNNHFEIKGNLERLTNFSFKLYDRWGGIIYQTSDKNFKWNGTVNEKLINQGSYFYKIDMNLDTGERQTKKGEITIIY